VTTRDDPRKIQAGWAAAVLLGLCLAVPAAGQQQQPQQGAVAANAPIEASSGATGAAAIPPRAASNTIDERQPVRRAAAPTSARPTTQQTGVKSTSTGKGFDSGRVTTALAVVVILILLLRWGAKRFFGVAAVGRSSRAVQVMARTPVSPRQQLMVLRVGRRLLVVADGGSQMNTLSEITDPDEVAALVGQLQGEHGERAGKGFGSLFSKMRGQYEAPEAENEDAEPSVAPQGGRFAEHDEEQADHPAVASTRQELSGLMDKVRLLSRQFKS
jgi:flagellar biogenesis protein FliO